VAKKKRVPSSDVDDLRFEKRPMGGYSTGSSA
jgi:hypothetical protein